MLDREEWQGVSEGNLARTWEKKLRPREYQTVQVKRRWASWSKTLLLIGSLWVGGMMATFLAVQVMVMGYQVDALNQSLTQAQRHESALNLQYNQLVSPQNLMTSAARYHMTLRQPGLQIHQSKALTASRVKTSAFQKSQASSGGSSKTVTTSSSTSSSAHTATSALSWTNQVSHWLQRLRGALTSK